MLGNGIHCGVLSLIVLVALVLPKVMQATFVSSFPCVFASRLAARSRLRFPPAIPLLLPPRGPPVVFLFFPFLSQ